MGEVAAELALERLETPRTRIPAGSLAIAATMSCVFPLETPCGWHVIGRCPVRLWHQVHATALLAPGDKVRFAPVSLREFERLASGVSQGDLKLEPVGEIVGAAA
jgi:allophanate hydrolase subunit 1